MTVVRSDGSTIQLTSTSLVGASATIAAAVVAAVGAFAFAAVTAAATAAAAADAAAATAAAAAAALASSPPECDTTGLVASYDMLTPNRSIRSADRCRYASLIILRYHPH